MKKIIIKMLSLGISIILTLLTLFSCNQTVDPGEQNGGNNNTNNGCRREGVCPTFLRLFCFLKIFLKKL